MIARRIAHISALNLIDYGIRFGAVLVVTPFLLDQIGKETYGLWLFLISLLGYLNIVELGLANTAVRFFATSIRSSDGSDTAGFYQYFRILYRRVAVAAIVFATVAAFVAPFLTSNPETARSSSLVFLLGGGVLGATFFLRVRVALMKAHLDHRMIVFASLIRFLSNTVGILLVLPRFPGITTLAILWTGAAVLEQALLWWTSRPLIPDVSRSIPLPRENRREIFGFARKSLANNASDYLRNRADTVVLGTMVSVTSVAHYGIGTRFLILFQDLAIAVFGSHLLSVFARMTPNENGQLATAPLYRTLRFSVPFACLGSATLGLLGPTFIDLWMGPGFEESHVILRWLAIPYALTLMQLPVNPWISAQNRQGWLALSKLIGGLLNLVGSLLLVLTIGFPGVVIATAIEMTIIALLALPLILHLKCGVPILQYLRALGLPAAQVLPAIAGTMAICGFWSTQTWGDFVLHGLAILFIFAVNTWFVILGHDERRLVLGFLDRQPKKIDSDS